MSHTKQHHPFLQCIMFWGALSAHGPVALLLIDGTMTAIKYIATLQQHLLPFLDDQPLAQNYVFQHDNAPSHKAGKTVAFLGANSVEVLDSWPPYSPELFKRDRELVVVHKNES
jgi:hypothetical protein